MAEHQSRTPTSTCGPSSCVARAALALSPALTASRLFIVDDDKIRGVQVSAHLFDQVAWLTVGRADTSGVRLFSYAI